MNDIRSFALNMISRNPNIANNELAQEMISVIQNNDSVRGQQIADNLCRTHGVTREQAIQQASQSILGFGGRNGNTPYNNGYNR